MSILAALNKAYERLALRHEVPTFGFSSEKIGFILSLNPDGSLAAPPIDWRDVSGKKPLPRLMSVPQPVKRTSGIAPNFLWDKSSYVLGITAGEGKRLKDEHQAFIDFHTELLGNTDDEGLKAVLAFCRHWNLDDVDWPEEIKTAIRDQNIVFTLESERRDNVFIHDRLAAKQIWATLTTEGDKSQATCLVTGEKGPIARLHPSIKGVWGGQSSGADIVSFNLPAFTSYGQEQGNNAPVSEAAVFGYTTALNRFLRKDSGHRLTIGDTSLVFWADATDVAVGREADDLGGQAEALWRAIFFDVDDAGVTVSKIKYIFENIRKGRPLRDINPTLADGVRFFVLGLAPNASRVSIRFWFADTFGVLAENYQAYLKDMEFTPWPKDRSPPTIGRCALRTAPAQRNRNGQISFDKDRVSPLLAGDLLRAVLTRAPFPRSLLSHLLMRVRGDQLLDSTRIALIKAILVRDMRLTRRLPETTDSGPKEEYLMRSQPDDPNPARRLGRLFAVIERTQLAALGDKINATVKDKFLSAAAATPQQVFTSILKNAQNHLKRLRNGHSDAEWIENAEHARRISVLLDRDIGRLCSSFENGFPAQHSSEEQGLFLVGYYQERFASRTDLQINGAANPEIEETVIGEG